MPQFRSDEILWYDNGIWGQLGYGCPNFGDDPSTLNNSIAYLVGVIGRNLSAVMHHSDADMRVPPTVNTLMRIHKLITRARSILAGRAVPDGQARFEPTHATPAPEVFLMFPVPYFKVRSPWLKEYGGLILNAIGEMCQHTDNRQEFEISVAFSGIVGQYLQRVYIRMATELLQVPLADAQKPDFTLTDANFASYNPSKFFTATELIDTVPSLGLVPTEDDLRVLTDGIPANIILNLKPYPRGELFAPVGGEADEDANAAATLGGSGAVAGTAKTSAPAFAPPPSV